MVTFHVLQFEENINVEQQPQFDGSFDVFQFQTLDKTAKVDYFRSLSFLRE